MLLAVVVHPANIQDRDGAKLLLSKALKYGRLRCIFADRGYAGTLLQWVKQLFGKQGTRVEIVSKAARGFHVLPKRWIVERTFAWLNRYRRLSKDYEINTSHSEAFIYIALTHLMTRRLAK